MYVTALSNCNHAVDGGRSVMAFQQGQTYLVDDAVGSSMVSLGYAEENLAPGAYYQLLGTDVLGRFVWGLA